MATKKQRRRRQKGRRHEYEYVYIDEEGNEVEVEEPESKSASSKNGRSGKGAAARSGRSARNPRPMKPVQPPTWRYMRRQGLIFFVILFVFSLLIFRAPVLSSLLLSAMWTGFMLPALWLMQRMLYRSYLRRTGQRPSSK